MTPVELEALARAYRLALLRGAHSEGQAPAVAVHLAELAWLSAAVKLGGAGLLRLWDKLAAMQAAGAAVLTERPGLQQIAPHGEQDPNPKGGPPETRGAGTAAGNPGRKLPPL